ncbi:hypothetical protein HDU85_002700 [Gaertneriomyces sp. JEL0708]|nr:hypothetical protein HDU85_002700 [Gaertneriomyces sp. JEL0708]
MEPDVNAEQIYTLEALELKLRQLHESLNDLLMEPDNAQWPSLLSRFNVLVALYRGLLTEMRAAWLKNTFAIPSMLPAENPEFLPNVLLRTKLIPEIEEAEEEQRKNAPHPPGLSSDDINFLDEAAVRNAIRSWEARIEEHDKLVHSAIEVVRDKELRRDLKIRLPKEDDDGTKILQDATKDNSQSLERYLKWMAGGPEAWLEEERRAKPFPVRTM